MTERATIQFTPAEAAALRGEGNPYPDVKVETTDGETGTAAPDTSSGDAGDGDRPNKSEAGKAGDGTESDTGTDGADGDEEVTEVADSTNPDGPPRRKMIAFGAYDKKRIEANKAKEEAARLREQVAYLSGLAQQQKPAQPLTQQTEDLPLTPPDKAKEPEKYLAWLENGMARLLQAQKQSTEQTQQSSQFQQINQAVYEHEQAFINGDPENGVEAHTDFLEAVNFLRDKQTKELKAAGYEAHEINQILVARA